MFEYIAGIKKVTWVDDLGPTAALTNRFTGEEYKNKKFIGVLSADNWAFVDFHEEAHAKFNTTDEIFCDAYASEKFFQAGGTPSQSIAALVRALPFTTPEHLQRLHLQVNRAAKWDCENNGKESACNFLKTQQVEPYTTPQNTTGNTSGFSGPLTVPPVAFKNLLGNNTGIGTRANTLGQQSLVTIKTGQNINNPANNTGFDEISLIEFLKSGKPGPAAGVSAMPAQVFDEFSGKSRYVGIDGSKPAYDTGKKPQFTEQDKIHFPYLSDDQITPERKAQLLALQYNNDLADLNRAYNECQQSCKANHPFGPVIQSTCVKGCTSNYNAQVELLKLKYTNAQTQLNNELLSATTLQLAAQPIAADLQLQAMQADLAGKQLAAEAANPALANRNTIAIVVIAAAALIAFIFLID